MAKKVGLVLGAFAIVFVVWLWYIGKENPNFDNKRSEQEQVSEWERAIWEDPHLTEIEKHLNILVYRASLAKGTPLTDPKMTGSYIPSHRYQTTDLVIVETANVDYLKDYGKVLGIILGFYEDIPPANPMKATLEAVETRNEASLRPVRAQRDRHMAVARELVAVPLPKPAAETHLQLINAILGLAEANFHMSRALQEPILALEHSETYPARVAVFNWALQEMNNLFKNQGIIFESSERVIIPSPI